MAYIRAVGAKLILFALLSLTFGILGGLFASRASAGFASNLQHDMYYHIQEFSFSNIDKFSTSGLVTRLTTDVTNVQNAYQMILRMAIRAPFSMIIAMIMAFIINSRIASIYLVAVILLGIVLFFIMQRATKYFR